MSKLSRYSLAASAALIVLLSRLAPADAQFPPPTTPRTAGAPKSKRAKASPSVPNLFGLPVTIVELTKINNELAVLEQKAIADDDHAAAIEQEERLLSRARKSLGADHAYLPTIMERLALHYEWMGRYDKCKSLYESSLRLNQKLHGQNDFSVSKSLNSLGSVLMAVGEYPRAEALLQQSLAIVEKASPGEVNVALILGNLAACESQLGKNEEAARLLARSLSIVEAKLGPNSPVAAMVVGNLSAVFERLGRTGEAVRFAERQVAIWELRNPQSPVQYLAYALLTLSQIRAASGDYAGAEVACRRGLKLAKEQLGPGSRMAALGNVVLGSLLAQVGRRNESEPLLEEALKTFDVKHEDPSITTRVLHELAALHSAAGEIAVAADEFQRVRRIVHEEAARVLTALSGDEQARFLGHRDRKMFYAALSFAVTNSHHARVRDLSAVWLVNGKAAAQQEASERTRLTSGSTDPRAVALSKKLNDVRSQLAALTQRSQRRGNEKLLEELEIQAEDLERQLSRARGQTSSKNSWAEIADIRQHLADDAVLIDIARFDLTTPTAQKPANTPASSRYAAWIVPPAGKGDVHIVDLGDAKEIESAVDACRQAIGAVGTIDLIHDPLTTLSRLIMEPLLPHLTSARELVISPDATLWFVPWGALLVETDKRALTFALEKWRIRYVTGGREVLQPSATDADLKGIEAPCVFADPDYDVNVVEAAANTQRLRAKKTQSPGPKSVAGDSATPAAGHALAERGAATIGRASRLAGTAVEAKATMPYLSRYAHMDAVSFLEKEALEGVFKELRSPKVLVLWTHGFFLPSAEPHTEDRPFQPLELGMGTGISLSGGRLTENPLLRCGLLLAGCNNREQNKNETLDDGVLTGLEIASADLRHTQLVVLSACETGVGDVTDGNSVACIRRAFQAAGARAVVATLWRIPDQETTWLMTRFWANLARGQTKAEALRDAQLMILRQHAELRQLAAKRSQGQLDAIVGLRGLKLSDNDAASAAAGGAGVSQHTHPFYWAAFTLTGD